MTLYSVELMKLRYHRQTNGTSTESVKWDLIPSEIKTGFGFPRRPQRETEQRLCCPLVAGCATTQQHFRTRSNTWSDKNVLTCSFEDVHLNNLNVYLKRHKFGHGCLLSFRSTLPLIVSEVTLKQIPRGSRLWQRRQYITCGKHYGSLFSIYLHLSSLTS